MGHHHNNGRSDLVKSPHAPHAERKADWDIGDFFSNLFGDPQQQAQQRTTVVSVVIVSASNTFPPTVPVQWVTPTLTNGPAVQATGPAPGQNSKTHSSVHTPAKSTGEIMATSIHNTATRLNIAASGPSTASAAAATTTTTPSSAQKSSGLSGGAKAGLALGVLILIGGVLALVLVIYKRKKDKEGSQRLRDDEKEYAPPVPPPNDFYTPPAREPSVRTARTASTAPRLSLRPVTQFSPMLDNNNRGFPNRAETPTGALPMTQMANVSRDNLAVPGAQSPSAWERRGAAGAQSSPTNPFGDHAETADSPTLPKTGSVASALPNIETNSIASHAAAPISPITSGPPNMTGPVAGAAAGAAVGAAAVAARRGLPPPIAVNADSVSGSPLPSPANSAWTDDIPASPGPAPAGAPPMAGAAGPSNVHRVQMDFTPSMEDELEIRAGQLVRMLHEYDDGWALCIRLDRSQQGVAPRSCLSKHPVKPRAGPPRGPPPPRGPGPMGPGGPGPLTPNGRTSPQQFPGVPRPLTPNGRNSPGPYANQPRPMSPGGYPMGQPNRPRANSNAPAYGRSMSPGPYGQPGQQPQRSQQPDIQGRRRSNSASQILGRRNSPPRSSPLTQFGGGVPRKPVPGQAM